MASAYPAAVFVIVPIDNIMATVFDTPVATVGGKHALSVGVFRSSAGNAIGDFTGAFTAFFISGFPLNDKGLSDVGEAQIGVKFGGSPDFADFDPAVVRGVTIDIMRILPVFKVQGDVLKKTGLVSFDGEVVMSVSLVNQIGGDLTLGQEGIGGNFFSLNLDGIKEGDGGFDFVSALDVFVFYGQGTHFFWV